MNAGDFGMIVTIIAAIALVWWIVRDSRRHNRETQEQERAEIIERCTFAPQSRAELREE